MRDITVFIWVTVVTTGLVWGVAFTCTPRNRLTAEESLIDRLVGQTLRGGALLAALGVCLALIHFFSLVVLAVGLFLIAFLVRFRQSQPFFGEIASFFALWEVARRPGVWHRLGHRLQTWLAQQVRHPQVWLTGLPWATLLPVCFLVVIFFLLRSGIVFENTRLLRPESYDLALQAKYIRFNTTAPDRTNSGLSVLVALVSTLAATDAVQVVRFGGILQGLALIGVVTLAGSRATRQPVAGLVAGGCVAAGVWTAPLPEQWRHLSWPPDPVLTCGANLLHALNQTLGRQVTLLPLEVAALCALATLPAFWTGCDRSDRRLDALAGVFLTTLIHPASGLFLTLAGSVCLWLNLLRRRLPQPRSAVLLAAGSVMVLLLAHGLVWLGARSVPGLARQIFSWLDFTPVLPPGTLAALPWSQASLREALRVAPMLQALALLGLGGAAVSLFQLLRRSSKEATEYTSLNLMLVGWTLCAFATAADTRLQAPIWSLEARALWPLALYLWLGASLAGFWGVLERAFPRLPHRPALTCVLTLLFLTGIPVLLWVRGGIPLFRNTNHIGTVWCGRAAADGGVQFLEYDQAARLTRQLTGRFKRGTWRIIAPGEQFVESYGEGWHTDLSTWMHDLSPDRVRPATFRFELDVPHTFVLVEKRPWQTFAPDSLATIGFAEQTDITFRAYRSIAGRSSLMFETLQMLRAYGEQHHNLSIYFEDADLIIFQLSQEQFDSK
ncbi:MAG: hypothetical protein K1Y36_03020 [Blastocatellia bacterium]|nr:hypothetical protein [Blastocatellia bacterium]